MAKLCPCQYSSPLLLSLILTKTSQIINKRRGCIVCSTRSYVSEIQSHSIPEQGSFTDRDLLLKHGLQRSDGSTPATRVLQEMKQKSRLSVLKYPGLNIPLVSMHSTSGTQVCSFPVNVTTTRIKDRPTLTKQETPWRSKKLS